METLDLFGPLPFEATQNKARDSQSVAAHTLSGTCRLRFSFFKMRMISLVCLRSRAVRPFV